MHDASKPLNFPPLPAPTLIGLLSSGCSIADELEWEVVRNHRFFLIRIVILATVHAYIAGDMVRTVSDDTI